MKTKILAGLFLMLAASAVPVRAEDNSSQAAARAALLKKLIELDHAQPRPQSNWDTGAATNLPESTNRAVAPAATNAVEFPVVPVAIKPAPEPKPITPPGAVPVKPIDLAPTPTNPPSTTVAIPTPAPPPPKVVPAAAASTNSPPPAVAPSVPPTPAPAKPKEDRAPTENRPTPARVPAHPGADLVTFTGATYHNVQVERVETNAIIISYVPAGGGTAMTRVYFEELAPAVRQQFEKK